MASEETNKLETLGLVGRCFHVFDNNGYVKYQGIVRGELGNGNYLVQYFDWTTGSLDTMEIRNTSEMKPGRKEGCWQFYEDSEHMYEWYKSWRTSFMDVGSGRERRKRELAPSAPVTIGRTRSGRNNELT